MSLIDKVVCSLMTPMQLLSTPSQRTSVSEQRVLYDRIELRDGRTWYVNLGDGPVIAALLLVLGLSAVMLARGAAGVLAPLTVVRELECADFVADVYTELAAGESLACAAANVRGRWLQEDDLSRWAVASSFTCFGSGASSVAG